MTDIGQGWWSGYAPGKPGREPDELPPLNSAELRAGAQRFRAAAAELDQAGKAGGDWRRRAADDFDRRADAIDGGAPEEEPAGRFVIGAVATPQRLRVDATRMRGDADALDNQGLSGAHALRRLATFLREEADRIEARGSD